MVRGDAIYWEGERANIAALTAAAWRCGWAALEEFAQPKKARRLKFAGRADLFLLSPRCEEYVEAKSDWLYVTSNKSNTEPFQRAFRAAGADARKLHLEPGKHRRVGVAFGTVYTPYAGLTPLSPELASVFGNLSNEDFDAAAWCFPMAAQVVEWTTRSVTCRYPGVVFLAKAVV